MTPCSLEGSGRGRLVLPATAIGCWVGMMALEGEREREREGGGGGGGGVG